MLRMQRGSGYEQAEAELRFVKAVEVSVVLSPPPRGEVFAEAAHGPLLGLRPDPNIAFDVIGNRPPWPENPDDNFSARSWLLIAIASEFIRGCERPVGLRAPL
jgi:hypothetical protein